MKKTKKEKVKLPVGKTTVFPLNLCTSYWCMFVWFLYEIVRIHKVTCWVCSSELINPQLKKNKEPSHIRFHEQT